MSQIETLEEELAVETLVGNLDLVVYNDDVNTFDHVIESFADRPPELEAALTCNENLSCNNFSSKRL